LSDESQDIPAKDEKEEDAQSETVPLADTVPQESPSRMLNRPRKKRLVFSGKVTNKLMARLGWRNTRNQNYLIH